MTVERTELTPKVIHRLRHESLPEAPWSAAPPNFWEFIERSSKLVYWSIEAPLLNRFAPSPSKPRSAATQANIDKEYSRPYLDHGPSFVFGIGSEDAHCLGGMTGTGRDGSKENSYSTSSEAAEASDNKSLKLIMETFWPDVPYLAFEEVRRLVSSSYERTERDYNEATNDYLVQTIDAGKIFRVLQWATRLIPSSAPPVDWKAVVAPPPKPTKALPVITSQSSPRKIKGRP
jgi:hypothetical protein